MTKICGPGLCCCDEASTCPKCGERKVEAGCDGLCEECYLEQPDPDAPDSDPVHDTWEEHRGER